MKWITNKTFNYKVQARDCWHYWFAWYPVVVKDYPDGAVKKVWLKTVLRKGTYFCSYGDPGWDYKYKEVT